MAERKATKKKTTIYLDNAGTTPMDAQLIKTMNEWCLKAQNPSSSSIYAKSSRDILESAREAMLDHCNARKDYVVIFTSGATESNCLILVSTVEAYWRAKHIRPTVLISAIEHSSIMECCANLDEDGRANICYIMPNVDGIIPASSIETAIKSHPNIAICSIIFANNELGSINNVREIGALLHRYAIPLHVDAVQMFGKYRIPLPSHNIDALSMSFHKFNGPKGLGALYIKRELIDGYKLRGQFPGSQQFGLRAGTENIPAIACSIVALERTFANRERKNDQLWVLREHLLSGLAKKYPFGNYAEYVLRGRQDFIDGHSTEYDASYDGFVHDDESPGTDIIENRAPIELLALGGQSRTSVLPNILLLAVIKNTIDNFGSFCNVKLKEDLDARGIVVSIGSACNTNKKEASHVIKHIRAPPIVRRGIIRISMGDDTTRADIDSFITTFTECVNKQIEPPNNPKQSKHKSVTKPQPTKSKTTKSKAKAHPSKGHLVP